MFGLFFVAHVNFFVVPMIDRMTDIDTATGEMT
jgi:hypothetical protein